MRNKISGLIVLSLFILSSCAYIPSTLPASHPDRIHYNATKHIFLANVLASPPRPSSIEDKQDMKAVLDAQNIRSQKQISEAQADAKLTVFRFQNTLGPKFNPKNLPKTADFFKNVEEDEAIIIEVAKDYYGRPRPYITSKLVKPIVKKPSNPSYPSGHACFAYLNAILLAKMLPEKAPQIFTRAKGFANNRIVAGVHYPSDVQAGMISAFVIAHDLMQDKNFMYDFNQAKQELRKSYASKLIKK